MEGQSEGRREGREGKGEERDGRRKPSTVEPLLKDTLILY